MHGSCAHMEDVVGFHHPTAVPIADDGPETVT